MGVKACSRHACPGIMCDHSVAEEYICNDCLAELRLFRAAWVAPLRASEVRARVADFMATRPGSWRVLTGQAEIDRAFNDLID